MRRRNEQGFVVVEFVLGLGVLLLPTALIVLNIPTWSERVDMTQSAAREAARQYVLSNDPAQAQQIVNNIDANYGFDDADPTLTLTGNPTDRGATVSATVSSDVPAFTLPLLGIDVGTLRYSSTHSEIVDLYRSHDGD